MLYDKIIIQTDINSIIYPRFCTPLYVIPLEMLYMNCSFDLSVVEDSLNHVAWSVSSATTTEITYSVNPWFI